MAEEYPNGRSHYFNESNIGFCSFDPIRRSVIAMSSTALLIRFNAEMTLPENESNHGKIDQDDDHIHSGISVAILQDCSGLLATCFAASLALTRPFSSLLFDVHSKDPQPPPGWPRWPPSARASRVDPMVALSYQ
jgi:hypothetical protein